MKKLSALTGIRFIAAFYVFIFHINLRIPLKFLMESIQAVISQGAIGVNVFFVLSGFILTYTYQHKIENKVSPSFYKEFLLKRLIRIYPAYLIGFIACIIVNIVFFQSVSYLLLFLNVTMFQSYIPIYSMKWYGSGSWSISTEFFFYFTFPFLIPLFTNNLKRNGLRYMLLLFIVLSALPAILFNLIPNNLGTEWIYTFPLSRLSEFISGIIASLLVFKYDWKIKEWIAIAGIIITAVYFAKFGNYFIGYTAHNWIVVPVTIAILVVCVNAEKTVLLRFLGSKVMVYLGEVSYGFYILQIPLVIALNYMIERGSVKHTDYWLIPILLAVNLIASSLMYKYIEHPVHRFLNNRMKENKAVSYPIS